MSTSTMARPARSAGEPAAGRSAALTSAVQPRARDGAADGARDRAGEASRNETLGIARVPAPHGEERGSTWSRLAAPLPTGVVWWRQDGRAKERDGKHFARFVAYIDANTVRERLDEVVPGEWDLTLDLLPPIPTPDGEDGTMCSFKARLQVLGVIREDVGTGRDYKAAATDAFKRAAVRFGIGHELYAYEQNWVEVDGDGRFARPLEDPQAAYDRRYGRRPGVVGVTRA